ncbi:MAG: dipeptidase [bacterium JZ-2024 1]
MAYFDLHTDALTHLGDEAFVQGENNAQWGLYPFLKAGGRVQVFAIYTPPEYSGTDAFQFAMKHLERLHRLMEKGLPLNLIRAASDLEAIPAGYCGVILSLEGATPLGREPENLRLFHRLGLRALGLTWNHRNAFADGIGVGESAGGLTDLGRDLLALCEDLGVAVDISHLHPRGVDDVLERATKPPYASHSNAQVLKNHPRNLMDEFIREVAARGGIIGVTFVPEFLHQPTVQAIAEHAEHIASIGGENSVSIGSDFCGCTHPPIARVSEIHMLWSVLADKGWTSQQIRRLSCDNALAYFRHILPNR